MDDDRDERHYSVDEERNGIYALLSLSAAGQQGPARMGSPGKVGIGKRKRSQVALSPVGRSRPHAEIGSPYRRETVKLPEWTVKMQKMLERVVSGQCPPGKKDVHGTPMSFITREFFYSEIDAPWYREKTMDGVLRDLGLPFTPVLLHTYEWWALLSLMGDSKPRRLSEAFLHESRMELQRYRDGLSEDKVPFVVGQGVTAIHPVRRELHDGVILTLSKDACRVQFDKIDLGVHLVRTSDIGKKGSLLMPEIPMSFVMPPLHYFMQQYVHSNAASPEKMGNVVDANRGYGHSKDVGGKGQIKGVMGIMQHILDAVSQHQDAGMIQQHVDGVFDSCMSIIEANKKGEPCMLKPKHVSTQGPENQSRVRDHVHGLLQTGLSNRIKEYVKILMVLYRFPDVFDAMMEAMHQMGN